MNRFERVRTIEAATDALGQLQIDQTRPVDPFRALEDLQLEIGFWRLDALLGAIVPGERPGVMITTERPHSVQRYTAAHEIGHWYLDKDHLSIDLPVDTTEEVLGTPTSDREMRAQVFASYFLMPLPLLARTARRHGVSRGSPISPLQAYSISRDMHVSYVAAVRQLENCHFLNSVTRAKLLKVRPAALKRTLAFGRPPTVARRDVWAADRDERHLSMEVYTGDDLAITLPENRTTGYRWVRREDLKEPAPEPRAAPQPFGERDVHWHDEEVADPSSTGPASLGDLQGRGVGLLPVFDEFARWEPRPGERVPVGVGGERRLVLNAQFAGDWTESYVYAAPFAGQSTIEDELSIRLHVRPLPEQEALERRLRQVAAEVG